jgi:hypothetical protein
MNESERTPTASAVRANVVMPGPMPAGGPAHSKRETWRSICIGAFYHPRLRGWRRRDGLTQPGAETPSVTPKADLLSGHDDMSAHGLVYGLGAEIAGCKIGIVLEGSEGDKSVIDRSAGNTQPAEDVREACGHLGPEHQWFDKSLA